MRPNPFMQPEYDYYGADMAQGYPPMDIGSLISAPTQPQEPQGMAQQILSARFQPNIDDIGNSAVEGVMRDTYVNPQQYSNERMDRAFKQMAAVAEMQKARRDPLMEKLAFERFQYTDPQIMAGKIAVAQAGAAPMAAWDPRTNQPVFVPRGAAAAGGFMPPPPSQHKYGQDGRLVRTDPSVRDEMRLGKAEEAANAAINVERSATEANEILSRYTTNLAAPIMGGWQQALNVVGMADPQAVEDYENLVRISKEMGAQALQQFGGNDTDRELMIAIQSNINPKAKTETNINVVGRKLLASKILQEKPVFQEEWLNKYGSLTAASETGETFSRAWMKQQRGAWNEGLAAMKEKAEAKKGGAVPAANGIKPPTPEEEAEYMRLRQPRSSGGGY